MTTTAAPSPIRGRPTTARLQEALERARLVNVDLRSRLAVERIESAEFAEHVRRIVVTDLKRGIELGREDIVDHARGELGYRAGRRLAQLAAAR